MPVTPQKTFYIVEIFTNEPVEITKHRPGWRFEVYTDKYLIPEEYFPQDETHCFFRYVAENEEVAIKQFRNDREEENFHGLLLTHDREEM